MSQDEIKKQEQQAVVSSKTFNVFDPNQFAIMQRYCKMYANSDLVPDSYRINEENNEEKAVANCMIAMDIAMRLGASPLMVMQNMVPIYGKPSWSSKFLIATINACGRFKPLQYRITTLGKVGSVEYTEYSTVWETGSNGKKYKKSVARVATFDGSNIDNIECVAYTYEKNGTEILESTPVDIVMAIKEGWYTKNGSKWQTMPMKMLKYRSASFWANEYAPELSMGIYTVEENEDTETIDVEAEVIHTKINEQPRQKVSITPASKDTNQAKESEQKSEDVKPVSKVRTIEADEECGY